MIPSFQYPTSRTTFQAAEGLHMGKFNTVRTGGTLGSQDYVAATTGWQAKADGSFEINNATIRGSVVGATIDIGGSDSTSFHVDATGQLWLGNASYASAPFKVSSAGALSLGGAGTAFNANTSGDIWTGASSFSSATWRVAADGTMRIGANGTTSFYADTSGNIWTGASTYAAAPFRVANSGDMRIGANGTTSFYADNAGNIWSGASTQASAKFAVANDGTVTAKLFQTATSGQRLVIDRDLSGQTNRVIFQTGRTSQIAPAYIQQDNETASSFVRSFLTLYPGELLNSPYPASTQHPYIKLRTRTEATGGGGQGGIDIVSESNVSTAFVPSATSYPKTVIDQEPGAIELYAHEGPGVNDRVAYVRLSEDALTWKRLKGDFSALLIEGSVPVAMGVTATAFDAQSSPAITYATTLQTMQQYGWTQINTDASSFQTVTFPVAFPNGLLAFIASPCCDIANSTAAEQSVIVCADMDGSGTFTDRTKVRVRVFASAGTGIGAVNDADRAFSWIAIGW